MGIERFIEETQGNLAWNLLRPCGDCPFRRDAPTHLGIAGSLPGYRDSIEEGRFVHTCHKTDNRPECDGPRNYDGPTEVCAGSLLFLMKSGNSLQLPLVRAIDDGRLDIHKLAAVAEADETVFESIEELFGYYAKKLEEHVANLPDSDPEVIAVVSFDSAETARMPRSEADRQGLHVITCATCGQPADRLDSLWPYYQAQDTCAACDGRSPQALAAALNRSEG